MMNEAAFSQNLYSQFTTLSTQPLKKKKAINKYSQKYISKNNDTERFVWIRNIGYFQYLLSYNTPQQITKSRASSLLWDTWL